MTGRVLGWLLVCDPPEQSAAQLAEALDASKGAISGATAALVRMRLVERLRIRGERADRFRMRPEAWDDAVREPGAAEAERCLRPALRRSPPSRRRVARGSRSWTRSTSGGSRGCRRYSKSGASTSGPDWGPGVAADAGAAAVEVEGLRKRFGDVVALDGLDLRVEPGTVFGLLGPNGAGKTTLVRIVATLLPADGGRAEVLGHDVVRESLAVRRRIGLAGQFAAVDAELTGRENVVMIGRLMRLSKLDARRRADEVLERFGLSDAADRRVGTYSGGCAAGSIWRRG